MEKTSDFDPIQGHFPFTSKLRKHFIYNDLGDSPRRPPFGIVLALNNRESTYLKYL